MVGQRAPFHSQCGGLEASGGGGKSARCLIKCLTENSPADKAQGASNSLGTFSHARTHAYVHTHTQTQKHTALKGSVHLPPRALDMGTISLAPQTHWISARRGKATLLFSTSELVSGTFYVFSLFFDIGLQLENSTME